MKNPAFSKEERFQVFARRFAGNQKHPKRENLPLTLVLDIKACKRGLPVRSHPIILGNDFSKTNQYY